VHHLIHSVVLVYLVLVAVLSVLLLLLMAWQALVGRRQIPAHGNPAPSPTDQRTEKGGDQAADTEHRRREGPDAQISGPATSWARPQKATTSAARHSAPATRGASPSREKQTDQKWLPDVAQRAEAPHQHQHQHQDQDRRSRDQQDEPVPPQVLGRHAVPVPAPSGRCARVAVTGVSGRRGNGGEESLPGVPGRDHP
jgi:hypothetical protein